MLNIDASAYNEYGPSIVTGIGDYVEYYNAAWVDRYDIGVLMGIAMVVPHLIALAYVIFMDQFESMSPACSRCLLKRRAMLAEKRWRKKEAERLAQNKWAKPSTYKPAKEFESVLSDQDSSAKNPEDIGSVGIVVESKGMQCDPELPMDATMDEMKKCNMRLFEEGRALQAKYRVLAKKIAAAKNDASKVGPDLQWRRQKIEELKSELATVEAENEKLAFANRQKTVGQHMDDGAIIETSKTRL
jgi:hypothetical protein